MEYVNCNLCGEDNYRLLFAKEEFNVVRCNKCGLIYINPRLTESELVEFVSGDFYRQHYVPSAFDVQENWRRHKIFLRKLRNYFKNGHLVDVGCASGLLLAAAREEGWEVKGVDISEPGVTYGRNKLGLDIFLGELEEAKYPDEYFDVVTCMDTIEHVQNPYALLKEANRILRQGGLIVVSTPNFNGLTRLFVSAKWTTFVSGHLYYFTRETARQILEKNGFEVRKILTENVDPYAILVSGILRMNTQQSKLDEARVDLKNRIESSKLISIMKRRANLVLSLLKIGDKLVIYAEKSVSAH